MGTCSWKYHRFSIPISAVWSGLRKHHPEHTDQQLQIRGCGKEDEKKKSPVTDLTSIYRDCSASFHWSHSSYRRGKGSRRRRKTSSTRKKGTAASKTGNTDYTTHLGNIHTKTQLSQGSKHFRKNLIISRMHIFNCPCQDQPQKEKMPCKHGVLSQVPRTYETIPVRVLPQHDSSFCFKNPGRNKCHWFYDQYLII